MKLYRKVTMHFPVVIVGESVTMNSSNIHRKACSGWL